MKILLSKETALLVSTALLACWPHVRASAATNLIVNGSFEQPFVPVGGWNHLFAPANFSGWVLSSGEINVVSTRHFASASGSQSIDLNGNVSGTVYQDIATSPGQLYRLRFAFAGNPHLPNTGPTIKRMEVNWGGSNLAVLEHDVRGYSATNVGWREFSFIVPGTGLDRLMFRSVTTGSAGPAIDAVSLTLDTDPFPAVDTLAIQKAVMICWPTTTGTQYQVQWAAKVDPDAWTYFGPPLAGNGVTNCVCDALGNSAMRVYRVITNP